MKLSVIKKGFSLIEVVVALNWVWDEEIYDTSNEDFFEYEVSIKLQGQDKYIYSIKGYLIK